MSNTILNVNPNEPLVIIGNGPSLKGFDFKRFRGLKTLGMNAAYRYWERIGWYPSYYCCLDDRLLETHYRQIYDLLMEEKVERVFVTVKFLEFYPDLASHDRVDILDSFIPYRYKTRGQKYGIPQRSSSAFLTDNPKKLTTGSYSVRYCIALGYLKILLLGIDCRYIPVVEGAKQVDDLKMVMEKTPAINPNYFFEGYQQAGDVFQVPNPEVHGGNLHLQSFEALRNDLPKYVPGVELINCNQASELYDKRVFSYQDFDLAVTGNRLGAIVVPTIKHELGRILENFSLWNRPNCAPYLQPPSRPSVYLHFVLNSSKDIEFESKVTSAFEKTELVKQCFKGIRFDYCNLEGMRDLYRRSYKGEVSAEGYKSGPNNQFFTTIETLVQNYPYIFYMETDCFPIKSNWLQKLIEIVGVPENFWIKGSVYRGSSEVSEAFQTHINGNAIYAVGDLEFQRFIREIWKPFLLKLTRDKDPRIAYDCALPMYFADASASSQDSKDNFKWRQWQNLANRFTYTNYIQNHSGTEESKGLTKVSVGQILQYFPDTYIVHGAHFADEVKHLALGGLNQNKNGKDIQQNLQGDVKKIKSNVFHFNGHYSKNYLAYILLNNVMPRQTLRGKIEVIVSTTVTIVLSLNRHGTTKFEGSMQRQTLSPGTHILNIQHTFKQSHSACRLQLGVDGGDIVQSLTAKLLSLTTVNGS